MIGATGLPSQEIISVEIKDQKPVDSPLRNSHSSTRIPQIVITWEIEVEVEVEMDRAEVWILIDFILTAAVNDQQKQ